MSETHIVTSVGATVPLGVVKEGSLRPQDVLTAALRTLEMVNPGGFVMVQVTHAKFLGRFAEAMGNEITGQGEAAFTSWDWDTLIDLTWQLVEAIDEVLPEGYEFSGHPDDPACIGIWAI